MVSPYAADEGMSPAALDAFLRGAETISARWGKRDIHRASGTRPLA